MAVTPYKVKIPEIELKLLDQKLRLARIAPNKVDWQDDNGIHPDFIRKTVEFWINEYDWRAQEALINQLPQFMTEIEVDDRFGMLEIHFVHSKSSKRGSDIPILFLHGWPGSFFEISKGLHLLNEAGFDVVAPSLPGYGFSSYSRKRGFDLSKHAEVMQKLMQRLGYSRYAVQGGDWGHHLSRIMAIMFPDNVKAMHLNMFQTHRLKFDRGKEPAYTAQEQAAIDRCFDWFLGTNAAYGAIQATKPTVLGMAMYDSPVGLLAWMCDKLVLWSDNYPWTPTELITWTLLHYFPGPATGFMMYTENTYPPTVVEGSWGQKYIEAPSGFSAFPKEIAMMPRSWAEIFAKVVHYQTHDSGGHFAMYEKPELLVGDFIEFMKIAWKPQRQITG